RESPTPTATGPSRFDRPRAGDRGLRALGVAGMSIWSMPSDASASRMALIMVCGAAMQPAWPAPLTPRGLTVVGCWASVTSVTGAWHRVVHQRAAQQLAGSLGADCAFEQPVPDTPGRSTHDRIRREDRGSYRWWSGLDDPDQMFYENY